MQQDLLSADELLGNIDSFTVEQRTARETFVEQELPPTPVFAKAFARQIVDASPAGRVATGIYNTLVELLARISPHSLRLGRVVPVLPVGPARLLQSLWRARSGARSTVHAASPVRH